MQITELYKAERNSLPSSQRNHPTHNEVNLKLILLPPKLYHVIHPTYLQPSKIKTNIFLPCQFIFKILLERGSSVINKGFSISLYWKVLNMNHQKFKGILLVIIEMKNVICI